jgi:DNA repair protein RadC
MAEMPFAAAFGGPVETYCLSIRAGTGGPLLPGGKMSELEKQYFKIKELPEHERPRERLEKLGPEALSDVELLAILLRTGTPGVSALGVANRILFKFGDLKCVAAASLEQLCEIDGVGRTKAIQIKAAFDLARRLSGFKPQEKPVIRSSRDVFALLADEMRLEEKECFKALYLDVKNHVRKVETISVGTLSASLVHPREVFKSAIRDNCASVIIVHNHPTGDPSPSSHDTETTERIKSAGKVLGIELLDHIIIGEGRYFSYKDKDLL